MANKVVTLDVREDLRHGREPFAKIMQVVAALKAGEELRLIAPFEPTPLIAILAGRGFEHELKTTGDGACEVKFFRGTREPGRSGQAGRATPQTTSAKPVRSEGPPVIEVDARGLEPPEPLVKILEALAALPAHARLRARTDRRPAHLYAQLAERGFAAESEEQADGSFVTYVHRA